MSGRKSRTKGASAEREVRDILRAHGIDCNRTPGSGALHWHQVLRGDISGWEGYSVEVKRQERIQIDAWCEQAERDAADNETPLVVYRRSRQPWRVVLKLEDFLTLVASDDASRLQQSSEGE